MRLLSREMHMRRLSIRRPRKMMDVDGTPSVANLIMLMGMPRYTAVAIMASRR